MRRRPEDVANGPILAAMSNIAHGDQEQSAAEAALRAHAGALRALGAEHGITTLRAAGPGRLVGHVGETRDLFDIAAFETAASELVGADVALFSDGVFANDNVSPDLLVATPL